MVIIPVRVPNYCSSCHTLFSYALHIYTYAHSCPSLTLHRSYCSFLLLLLSSSVLFLFLSCIVTVVHQTSCFCSALFVPTMAVPSGYSSSVPTLPPPRPRSPPEYPDLYGKRRETAKVQMLEREIGFLEEELKSMQGLQPASRCCKEVTDFVVANVDPIIPTNRKKRRPWGCGFWKWLCGSSCCNFSWICCSCCCCCTKCSCDLEMPRCSNCCKCIGNPCKCPSCTCSFPSCLCSCPKCPTCSCPSCFSCSAPKCPPCSCSCPCPCPCACACPCPRLNCFKKTSCKGSCCSCRVPSCPDCSCCCSCWSWKCSCWPKCPTKCPKIGNCCSCKMKCCNPCSYCLCF